MSWFISILPHKIDDPIPPEGMNTDQEKQWRISLLKRRIIMKHNYFRTCLLLVVALLATTLFSTTAFAALPEGVPSSLEALSIQKIELKAYEDGSPYFEAQVYFPQSVLDLDSESPGGGSVFWEYSVIFRIRRLFPPGRWTQQNICLSLGSLKAMRPEILCQRLQPQHR